jgi:phosphoglycolate phosphatase-like HAD superfamily hydrolase/uridine kinase
MINPNDINLIIFDMDGTILPSLMPFYECIKRAFAKLGWPVTFSPEEINRFFGVSTASIKGSVYEFITPPDSHLSVEEVRLKVRAENDGAFREMAQTYPGVKETLKTLRIRGYKLAQYTNATTTYLNAVMSSLEIRDYYDYVECIEDNHLTKPELVKKIMEVFGGVNAAVVGDRIHDIEAARENNCLSIGALFGYGEKEPEQADITINKFDDLLSIFDRRLPIFEKITTEIERKKPSDRPFVIGIDGIDCSGKTTFAAALQEFLNSKDYQTQLIHLDDFHNPKAIRYAGENQAENYFNKSFNIETIVQKLLMPLRQKGKHTATLKLLDLRTDKYQTTKKFSFNHQTIVLFEGVFLFRQELALHIDYKIFLDIPLELSKERAATRDSEAINIKYDIKYLPAQRRYLREYLPTEIADIIINNTNWEFPFIKHLRKS